MLLIYFLLFFYLYSLLNGWIYVYVYVVVSSKENKAFVQRSIMKKRLQKQIMHK